MLILDRGRDRPQRACQGVRANRADPTEQPVAQIPLLPVGQGRDSGGVIGPPLDQGQCLQDGVVQLVASSARSCARTRPIRSASSSRRVRSHHGPATSASTASVVPVAATVGADMVKVDPCG